MSETRQVTFFNPDTMFKPAAGYSQVVEVKSGKVIYVAGQVSIDSEGSLVGKDDLLRQAEQVFKNLQAAVEAAGGTCADIVKLNYFCVESVDPSLTPGILAVRDRFVNVAEPPISTFVVVTRLVRPEWLIEIEAVAVLNS